MMHCRLSLHRLVVWLLPLTLLAPAWADEAAERPYRVTEEREACARYEPLRRPFFGDTHVHTRYSLDASTQETRTTPAQAYRFARGERLGIQPWTETGEPMREVQLLRPLDFAVVTDHAELFGEVNMCQDPDMEGFGSWQCQVYRRWPRAAFFLFNTSASKARRLGMCGRDGELCREAGRPVWEEMQQAAEDAYDRSSDCGFSSFIGYEWTGASRNLGNLHRNIVFRNDQVPDLPISFVDAPSAEKLWHALDARCKRSGGDCDVIVIPHNSNISDGFMFARTRDDGAPITPQDAELRADMERLVEIMQHKGSSECYFGPLNTSDELCAYEQLPYDKFSGKFQPWLARPPKPDSGFVREVLKDGLQEQARIGVNPFKFGFIASTDTHLGAPGLVDKEDFPGHGGAGVPADETILDRLPDDIEFNPGGLAVLWAEENTRDSLFAAMQRREAYGTSGPRMTLRFFGGWDYPAALCEDDAFAETGYRDGVPMGGDLPRQPSTAAAPRFAVSALMDPGVAQSPGTPLQRVQIIKGWIDDEGNTHEQVFEVAGDPDNGAGVDLRSCQAHGEGFSQLCTVWEDPDFDPSQAAFYYARVVENPTCRWSQMMCAARQVDCERPETIAKGFEACCSSLHRPTIQERAWSSPIWYTPEGVTQASR